MQSPKQRRHTRKYADGFGLIVIAALFTAIAVISTTVLEKQTMSKKLVAAQAGQSQLTKIKSALNQYALQYGRLPCPAQTSIQPTGTDSSYGAEANDGKCTTSEFLKKSATDSYAGIEILTKTTAGTTQNSEMIRGMVPFKVLAPFGLTENDAYDAQNDRIMYVVNRNLTSSSSSTNISTDQAIITDSTNGTTMYMDFVLVSYGNDKLGGIQRGSKPIFSTGGGASIPLAVPCQSRSGTNATENCNGDIKFLKKPYNISSNGDGYFDDDVLGGRVTCSNGSLNRSSDGGCTNTYCWGNNTSGQLGNGTTKASPIPVAVTMPSGVTAFQSISINEVPATVSATTAAAACAISASFDSNNNALPYGDVYCWGNWDNSTAATGKRPLPQLISGGSFPAGFKATAVKVGGSSVCAMGGVPGSGNVPDGNIYCWGAGTNNQLGNGSTVNTPSATPVIVTNPASITFTGSFSAGSTANGNYWCAMGSDFKLYCWGTGYNGVAATAAAVGSTVKSIGGHATRINLLNGSLVDFANTNIFKSDDITTGSTLTPSDASRDANTDHECISVMISQKNTVYCKSVTGTNAFGQLGIGNTTNSSTFTAITQPKGTQFTQIAIGGTSTCALGNDGKAYCWGNNNNGQLGIKSGDNKNVPTAIAMPTATNNFTQIAVGGDSACAIANVQ